MKAVSTIVLLALSVLLASCKEVNRPPANECISNTNSSLISADADDFDVIIFGETHGNSQTPALFFGAVCEMTRRSEPVLVGMEIPPSSIEAVRDSNGRGPKEIFQNAFWAKSRDGRSSIANLELIQRLVQLESDGYIRLIGFDRRITGREDFGLSSLSALESDQSGKTASKRWILLTGMGHSRYANDPHSLTYAIVNSGRRTKVVDLSLASGTTWACVMGECKVQPSWNSQCENSHESREPVPGIRLDINNHCIESATASAPAADSATNIGE